MASDTQDTRVYCSQSFYDYLRKHVKSIFVLVFHDVFISWFTQATQHPESIMHETVELCPLAHTLVSFAQLVKAQF